MNNIYRKSFNPQGAYLFQTHLSWEGLMLDQSKWSFIVVIDLYSLSFINEE